MKVFGWLLIITILLTASYMAFSLYKVNKLKNQYKDLQIIDYMLENKKMKLLVADTETKWEKGLMYYRTLEGVDGMIFIFPAKEPKAFWNKNTLMDLDLYWIDGKKVIGKSYLPSIEKSKEIIVVRSKGPVDKVIEVQRK